jgi:hypothetical protein
MSIIKNSILTILIFLSSCKISNEDNNKNLRVFFTKTDWKDFNKKTLKKNKLEHLLIDNRHF